MEWKKLPVSQRLSDLEDGESRQGDVASLEDPGWYKPKRMQARLAVSDLVGTRQESGTPPRAPFKPEWEAKNSLKVDAVLSRPTKAAENQRRMPKHAEGFCSVVSVLLRALMSPISGKGRA
jgi:hypothetical protein